MVWPASQPRTGISAWKSPNMAAILSTCHREGFLAVTLALRATAKQSADSPTAIRKTESKSVPFIICQHPY
jgi:hypothetical protein